MKILLILSIMYSFSFGDDFGEDEIFEFDESKKYRSIVQEQNKVIKKINNPSLERLKKRKIRVYKSIQACIKKANSKIEVGECIDKKKSRRSKVIIETYKRMGKDLIY